MRGRMSVQLKLDANAPPLYEQGKLYAMRLSRAVLHEALHKREVIRCGPLTTQCDFLSSAARWTI